MRVGEILEEINKLSDIICMSMPKELRKLTYEELKEFYRYMNKATRRLLQATNRIEDCIFMLKLYCRDDCPNCPFMETCNTLREFFEVVNKLAKAFFRATDTLTRII